MTEARQENENWVRGAIENGVSRRVVLNLTHTGCLTGPKHSFINLLIKKPAFIRLFKINYKTLNLMAV